MTTPAIRRTAHLTLSPNPANCSAVVDGHDISRAVRALRVEYHASGTAPLLELDLVVDATVVDGEFVVVLKPDVTDALLAFGWTPPITDPEAMREAASRLLTAANEAEAGR